VNYLYTGDPLKTVDWASRFGTAVLWYIYIYTRKILNVLVPRKDKKKVTNVNSYMVEQIILYVSSHTHVGILVV